MANCPKCGTQLDENAKFCPKCGFSTDAASAGGTQKTADDISDAVRKFNNTADTTAQFDPADIENNKVMGVLAYFSLLVLIPLLAAPKSKFARYHANQGLVLFIVEIVWGVILTIISAIVGGILGIIGLGFLANIIISILELVSLLFFILAIIGIVNVVNGKAKELPIIGQFKILK